MLAIGYFAIIAIAIALHYISHAIKAIGYWLAAAMPY